MAPPDGVKAVEWRLLTNRKPATFEEAVELIEWYRCDGKSNYCLKCRRYGQKNPPDFYQ
jgi:hypothetical protein